MPSHLGIGMAKAGTKSWFCSKEVPVKTGKIRERLLAFIPQSKYSTVPSDYCHLIEARAGSDYKGFYLFSFPLCLYKYQRFHQEGPNSAFCQINRASWVNEAEVPYNQGDVLSYDETAATGFRSWSNPFSFQMEKRRSMEG